MARHKKRKKRNIGDVELNLTAMLDMAFQLLAFFVLTFQPAPAEGFISLHMPPPSPTTNINAGQKVGADDKNENAATGLNTLTITVTGDAAGNIDKMYVETKSVANLSVLDGTLRGKLGDAGLPYDQVLISVGPTLQYQGLMQVVDVCTRQKLANGTPLTKLSFIEALLTPSNRLWLPIHQNVLRFFRAGELPRILAMLGMLLVMALVILQARKPSTWAFLQNNAAEKKSAPEEATEEEPRQSAKPNVENLSAPEGSTQPEKTSESTGTDTKGTDTKGTDTKPAQPLPAEPEIIAGTDLDPDELADFRVDLVPVSDFQTSIPVIEVKAYARLFRWIENQSLDVLRQRAKRALPFREYVQKSLTERHRGELTKFEMTIRRITAVNVEGNRNFDLLGMKRLYEVWGLTEKSNTFFYLGVTAELPPGLKPGVYSEKGTFYGYYFKALNYVTDDAKDARGWPAPLFVGRLDWHPQKVAAVPPPEQTNSLLPILGVGGALLFGLLLFFLMNRGRRPVLSNSLPNPGASDTGFSAWLSENPATNEHIPPESP